jgi:hypothetical protein
MDINFFYLARTSLKGWSIQGDFLVPAQAQLYSESPRHGAGKPYGPRLLHVWLFNFELMLNGRAQWTLDKRARKRARQPRRPNCYYWSQLSQGSHAQHPPRTGHVPSGTPQRCASSRLNVSKRRTLQCQWKLASRAEPVTPFTYHW